MAVHHDKTPQTSLFSHHSPLIGPKYIRNVQIMYPHMKYRVQDLIWDDIHLHIPYSLGQVSCERSESDSVTGLPDIYLTVSYLYIEVRLDFCLESVVFGAETTFSGSLFHLGTTLLEKKFVLISVWLWFKYNFCELPREFHSLIWKNLSLSMRYALFSILYVSFRSTWFLRSDSDWNLSSVLHIFSHRLCTLSSALISFWVHGLQTGEQYSKIGRTRVE